MPAMRASLCLLFTIFTLGASACAPSATLAPASFLDAKALRLQQDDWRGERSGALYLKRSYEIKVGLAVRSSEATSRMRAHIVRLNWAKTNDIAIPIDAPANARLDAISARVISPSGTRAIRPLDTQGAKSGERPDPEQAQWTLRFPGLDAGEALEVVCDFEIPGTLTSDARWLEAADAPTAQLLIRYDVPKGAKATLQVRGAKASPVLTRQDGKQVFAVFMSDLPARGAKRAHVRYVTIAASVRGYKQSFATSWSKLALPYTKALVTGSPALRMNHKEPYRPAEAGAKGASEAFLWVRDRLQRADAMNALWSVGRPLPNLVTTNNLNAIDKVHLLRWLLDAAQISHKVAAVRSKRFATIDPNLPVPGAFDGALVYLPDSDLWLDPACTSCAPGELREDYRGAWALILPAQGKGVTLTRLPDSPGQPE